MQAPVKTRCMPMTGCDKGWGESWRLNAGGGVAVQKVLCFNSQELFS
jgi:hypothetical protein